MYAIKYFRDEQIVQRYRANGVRCKPVGWVIGTSRWEKESDAYKEANHITALGPTQRVQVIRV